jgi:hypothetical protein
LCRRIARTRKDPIEPIPRMIAIDVPADAGLHGTRNGTHLLWSNDQSSFNGESSSRFSKHLRFASSICDVKFIHYWVRYPHVTEVAIKDRGEGRNRSCVCRARICGSARSSAARRSLVGGSGCSCCSERAPLNPKRGTGDD